MEGGYVREEGERAEGRGVREDCQEAWLPRGCGSTRPVGDAGSAHHERPGPGDDEECKEGKSANSRPGMERRLWGWR